ncbi:MAG TPA: type II toxin-antitoxin system HicB family antitoxin [bacterium]|nr:type II toxin-antitoxin system HicB family antitoxin [bacterium]
MVRHFTLEYWIDDGWYVGKLKEIPGIFSQGETLEELEDNIQEAYKLMVDDEDIISHTNVHSKEIGVDI